MDHSNGSSSSMSLSMVFTTDHSTPLYSSQWTPTTRGAYAGTCVFLIVLAVISRSLLAYRHYQELVWHDKAINRRYFAVAGENASSEKDENAALTTCGPDESVRVGQAQRQDVRAMPWRLSTDIPRACMFTVQAGVGYLMMLAVMTLNVGYFLSVLAGLFIGELFVGRYIHVDDGHH